MERSFKKTPLKAGLLAIVFMMQAAGAISASVPAMVKDFQGHSVTSVQGLISLPSFSIMLFILLSTAIVKVIGKRNTVLLGLFLGLIGGVIPAIFDSFIVTQIGRFVYGAGIGMYTPLAVSLIGDFFQGDEQRTLLGVRSSVSALGNSITTFFAGLLMTGTWNHAFFVYLIFIPILVIFIWGYPRNGAKMSDAVTVIAQFIPSRLFK
jgi:MFS family permease